MLRKSRREFRVFVSSKMRGREADVIRSAAFRSIEGAFSDRFQIVNVSFDGKTPLPLPPLIATRECVRSSDLVLVILWQDSSYYDDRTNQTAIGVEVNEAIQSGKLILAYFEDDFKSTLDKVILRPQEFPEELYPLNGVGARLTDYHQGVMITTFRMSDVLANPELLEVKIKTDLENHLSKEDKFHNLGSLRKKQFALGQRILEAGVSGDLRLRIQYLSKLIEHSKRQEVWVERYDLTSLYIELAGLHLATGRINSASTILDSIPSLSTGLEKALWLALKGQCHIYAADYVKAAELTNNSFEISQELISSVENGQRRGSGVADDFVFLAEQAKLNGYLNAALLDFYAGDYTGAVKWIEKGKSVDQRISDAEGEKHFTVLQAFILMELLWKTSENELVRHLKPSERNRRKFR